MILAAKMRIQSHDILFVRSILSESIFFVLEMNMHLSTEKLPSTPVLEVLQLLYSIVWTRNPPLPYPAWPYSSFHFVDDASELYIWIA